MTVRSSFFVRDLHTACRMGAGASSASKTDLKATCGLLKTRCGVVRRKELEVSHQARREVVELLPEGGRDRARFACTKVVLEDYKIEMIDAVEFCADSLHQRAAALVNGGKEPESTWRRMWPPCNM